PKNYSGGFRGRMMLKDALAKSVNTIAVKLSLAVGREKVLANMQKMGITYLRKSCSMALGDTGMTPLDHTGGYAVFAAGGLEVHPYAIEEIHTLQGELLYSHQRDEPERKQIFDRKVVEELNGMLQGVVLAGTGRRAQLDFTNSVGKTGTSSNYRDAWFVGYTGQYVVGVWLGNDDFTPMARVTGGSFPAETWHNFLVLAHDTDNIPQIPGIPLHPLQIAEQERLAQMQQAVATDSDVVIPLPTAESVKDMSSATRQILNKIGDLLNDAPSLAPSDTKAQNRVEAPAETTPKASVASASGGPAPGPAESLPELASPQLPPIVPDSAGAGAPP
ncbi:MAG: penicillin-binding transpeptidase domain-containing protein, partial [Methyloceanibacter sp.]